MADNDKRRAFLKALTLAEPRTLARAADKLQAALEQGLPTERQRVILQARHDGVIAEMQRRGLLSAANS